MLTPSRRSMLHRAIWIVGLLLVAAGCGGKDEKGSDLAATQGTLEVQSTRVEWQDGTSKVWTPVSAPQQVKGSDALRTDVTGHALLTFFTGTQMDILPSSELVVHGFEQSPDGGVVITLEQLSGETLHRVELVADTDSRYELDTPVAHLVVRGTVFGVQVAPDGATTVEVQQGTVEAQVGVQQFSIPAGQALDVDAQKNTTGPRPIAMPALSPTPTNTITPLPTSAFQGPVTTPTPTIGAILPPPASATSTVTATPSETPTLAPSDTPTPEAVIAPGQRGGDPLIEILVNCNKDFSATFIIVNNGGAMSSPGTFSISVPDQRAPVTRDFQLGAGESLSFVEVGDATVTVTYGAAAAPAPVSVSTTATCLPPTETPQPAR